MGQSTHHIIVVFFIGSWLCDHARLDTEPAVVQSNVHGISKAHLMGGGPRCSEREIERQLNVSREVLHSSASLEDQRVARLLPQTLKAACTLVKQCGLTLISAQQGTLHTKQH